jgi:hypothetical protein
MKIAFWTLGAAFLLTTAASADTSCVDNPRCEFHFPTSSVTRLEPSWLRDLSKETLWQARNEILARHGYAFETPKARSHFSTKPYWTPRTTQVQLSPIERANIDLIKSFEDRTSASGHSSPTAATRAEVVGLDPRGDGFLSVRAGPSASNPELNRLLEGDRVTITAASGAWRRIEYWGGEGWAHSNWLSATSITSGSTNEQSSLPVSAAPSQDAEQISLLLRDIAAMTAQIEQLQNTIQRHSSANSTGSEGKRDQQAASERVAALEQRRESAHAVLDRYMTPVTPQNANRDLTARQLSEAFQKVPFYIPGTGTIGEVWIEPTVNDAGELHFSLNFVDPSAEYQKVGLSIPMTTDDVVRVSAALSQVSEWSDTAVENKVRRTFEKPASCFPDQWCTTRSGGPYTTVLFRIAEDGSTSTVLKHSQGPLDRFYAFSMESTEVLAAYLDRVLEESSQEYRSATATDEDIEALFD